MVRVSVLLALAGLSAQTHASILGLDLVVSTVAGANWTDSIEVLPGAVVVLGGSTRHVACDYSFGSAALRVDSTGVATGDFASIPGTDSRVPPFNLGDGIHMVCASADAFRIDNAGDAASSAAGSVGIAQGNPTSSPDSIAGAPVLGCVFSIAMDAGGPNRDHDLLVKQVKAGIMTTHSTSGSTGGTSTKN